MTRQQILDALADVLEHSEDFTPAQCYLVVLRARKLLR